MVTDMKRSASFPFEKRTGKGLRKLRAIRRTPRPGAADVGSQDGGYPGRYPIQIKGDKRGGLNGSMQHLLAVYPPESQNPKSFAGTK